MWAETIWALAIAGVVLVVGLGACGWAWFYVYSARKRDDALGEERQRTWVGLYRERDNLLSDVVVTVTALRRIRVISDDPQIVKTAVEALHSVRTTVLPRCLSPDPPQLYDHEAE